MVTGAPVVEVGLRAGATKPPVLGFARADEQLKVDLDRAPIQAMAKATVKAWRAFDKSAKQAAQQGGGCPPAGTGMPGQLALQGAGAGAGPQTPAALELGVVAGGLSG